MVEFWEKWSECSCRVSDEAERAQASVLSSDNDAARCCHKFDMPRGHEQQRFYCDTHREY